MTSSSGLIYLKINCIHHRALKLNLWTSFSGVKYNFTMGSIMATGDFFLFSNTNTRLRLMTYLFIYPSEFTPHNLWMTEEIYQYITKLI